MPTDFYKDFWKKIKSGIPFTGEIINKRKNGELYYSIAHISPILNQEKEIVGFIGTEEDISELKNKQSELEQLNTRFLLATQSANIGVWEWDLASDLLIWDEQMYEIYGCKNLTKKEKEDPKALRKQKILPEDFEDLEKKRQMSIQSGTELDAIFRIQFSPTEIRFIKAHTAVKKDQNGKVTKVVGVNWDVTPERVVDQAKTEFVSLASHQLRTPLTSINWYTEILLGGEAGSLNQEQKKYLTEIYRNSKRMVELVSALLNVSRIELGSFVVDPVPTDPVKLVQEVIADLSLLATKKNLHISETHQDLPPIPLDQKIMKIVYENLLTNSIKYTPENGKIFVSHQISKKDPKQLEIKVSDTGAGIPAEEQDKIFDKLFRASNVQEIDTQGTGLGLYIVKAIVTQSGGSINFKSKENDGTTFIINLPLAGMQKKAGSKVLEVKN